MTLRLATTANLSAVLALLRAVVPGMSANGNFQWDEDYPNQAVFENDLRKGWLWVVEQTGQVVGVAALTPEQDAEYAQADWNAAEEAITVHRLAVHPDFQGRGVAGVLMKQAEVLAIERGFSVVRVDTNSENAATQALFPKLGYRFAGEISLGFRPGLRFFCYEKRVGPVGRAAQAHDDQLLGRHHHH